MSSQVLLRSIRAHWVSLAQRSFSRSSAREHPLYSKVNVFFGSQTGTARMFARELTETVQADFGCLSTLIDLDTYEFLLLLLLFFVFVFFFSFLRLSYAILCCSFRFNPTMLKADELSVFVCSSFGKGEPTDNAKKFNSWLNQPDESLSSFVKNTPFAVFGCGMSCTYPENYQVR